MAYAIAAYSITIGVLALYGLSMRHRERVTAVELARAASLPLANGRQGFNVGAALLAPIWMWAHGLRLPGALLGVLCLALWPLAKQGLWTPFLFVAAVPVAAGAALGFVGNRIAAEFRANDEPAALSASQLPWALAGIVFHVLLLPWVVYYFFFV